jgi:acetoin utilization deacetylase AcuC-like enzyme
MPRCSVHLANLESQQEGDGREEHLDLVLTNTTVWLSAGGGFHHCSSDRGGGFCAYADITLAIKVCL